MAVKVLVIGHQNRTKKERFYNVNKRIGEPCGVDDYIVCPTELPEESGWWPGNKGFRCYGK